MKTISGIIALMLLAGCAATPTLRSSLNATDADRAYCQDEAANTKTSALTKTLIWASNIIVLPVTAGLTLGTMPTIVYPRSDSERRGDFYWSCMGRLGYHVPQ